MSKHKQNKELFLGHILTSQFNDKIIIAFEGKWKNFFIDDKITFEVRIDKNKNFVLVGPQVRLQPTKRNPHYFEEVPMNENNL